MNDTLYLSLDTETGGLGDEVSILSAHFIVLDYNLNIVDELGLLLKPNDGHYVVNAEALNINKINLIEHDKAALTYSQAGGSLREFLWKHSQNGKIKLIPIGKNVAFDIKKLTDNVLQPKTWNQFVSYRLYDLTGLILFLKRQGKLDLTAPESLEGISKHFNIPIDAHTARGDAVANVEVLRVLEAL
jgi:hypothetical protein